MAFPALTGVCLHNTPQSSHRSRPSLLPLAPSSRAARLALRTRAVRCCAAGESEEARTLSSSALALALCNVNRVCMSVAVLPVALQFGWEPAVQGLVQASFLWGYTASQAQGGELADRYGGKVVVAAAIALFSLFTLLTPPALLWPVAAAERGAAPVLLLLARAAVGLGQGLVLPSVTNLLARHVPASRRASAVGLAFAGFHGGTILGLLLSPLLLQRLPLLLTWDSMS